MKKLLFLLFSAIVCISVQGAPTRAIDWKQFIGRHDLTWSKLPSNWYDAPFLGNGQMGAMIYRIDGQNAICFDIGNTAVRDHRQEEGLYGISRLLIGNLMLIPDGQITDGTMRLDLWNAELRGQLTTSKGVVTFKAIVHSDKMALAVETTGAVQWKWEPAQADSPRYLFAKEGKAWFKNPTDYVLNPKPEISEGLCVQRLNAGGLTATRWKERANTIYLNVSHSYPDTSAVETSKKVVEEMAKKSYQSWEKGHRAWWHQYYPQSFFSLSDGKKEGFYWIQMYKLAAATRADRPVIDVTGPWLTVTPWPATWWNLNTQLAYWPLNGANRLDLTQSLERALYGNLENLKNNVAEPYRKDSYALPRTTDTDCSGPIVGVPGVDPDPELGLLLWTCHNLWLTYRHTMDDAVLRDKLFPLLKGSLNYSLHFLRKGSDGKLHLPDTHSPEYGPAPDCTFDLALIRWGAETLLAADKRLGIGDPMVARWQEVLDSLVPYAQDERGLWIGTGVPYAKSHRHFSHLMPFYPLYLITPDQGSKERELMRTTLDYWQSLTGHHEGYSLTAAASMAAVLGDGQEALRYFDGLFGAFLCSNTFYKEAGPCVETPIAGAQTMHDMVLQSWGGVVRIFPAVPQAWPDVVFDRFLAEGAFLVSAERSGGKTRWVELTSRAGEPCVVQLDIENPKFSGATAEPLGQNRWRIALKKGDTVRITPSAVPVKVLVKPVALTSVHSFGIQ